MKPYLTTDCNYRNYRGSKVYVISYNRLQSEMMAFFIESCTEAICVLDLKPEKVRNLFDKKEESNYGIFLFDCKDVEVESVIQFVKHTQTKRDNYYVTLFNFDDSYKNLNELIHLGVKGVFHRDDSANELQKGICSIFNREIWISRKILTNCFSRKDYKLPDETSKCPLLTLRQKNILCLVAQGFSNQDIADELGISLHTVKTHIYNIYQKINVPSRTQAALWASKYL